MDETVALHAEHPRIVQRLKRAEGHLRRVIAMIEEGRPCLELTQQLQAVESAIAAAKRALIRDHIDHCLEAAVEGEGRAVREALDEFKDITKYL